MSMLRDFTGRMLQGKENAARKRSRGEATGSHASYARAARARAEAERNDPDAAASYARLQHVLMLASIETHHDLDAEQAIAEFCRNGRIVRASDIPF